VSCATTGPPPRRPGLAAGPTPAGPCGQAPGRTPTPRHADAHVQGRAPAPCHFVPAVFHARVGSLPRPSYVLATPGIFLFLPSERASSARGGPTATQRRATSRSSLLVVRVPSARCCRPDSACLLRPTSRSTQKGPDDRVRGKRVSGRGTAPLIERASDRRRRRKRSVELDRARTCPAHTRTHARTHARTHLRAREGDGDRDISSPRTCKELEMLFSGARTAG
jgi:hypothetical protein